MQYLKFYEVKASSTSDIASLTNSILVPSDSLDDTSSRTESTDSVLVPEMKKSKSVNLQKIIDEPRNKCELLNVKLIQNDNTDPIVLHSHMRVLESDKPVFVYHFIKRTNKRIKYIETTLNKYNIHDNSIILRGFETLKDSRWTYIHYPDNQTRCILNPSFINSKALHFNASTSPFVSVNFNDITSYHGMFSSMPKIKEIVIEKFDMSRVTSMEEMFVNCTELESISFIDCDLSNVETMVKLCTGCTKLKTLKFIRCKLSIMCEYWNMLSKCPLIESITIPLEIYRLIVQETPELRDTSITWHSA